VIESWMAESTLDLISSHVASGARLMARQKQIIAELKAKGADIDEAERTLAMLSDKIAGITSERDLIRAIGQAGPKVLNELRLGTNDA
jgi:hypothetical protein